MKKNYVVLILVALLIAGLAFYRYDYRPSKIKRQCSAEARFASRATNEPNDAKRQEYINRYYDDCLMRFGLK